MSTKCLFIETPEPPPRIWCAQLKQGCPGPLWKIFPTGLVPVSTREPVPSLGGRLSFAVDLKRMPQESLIEFAQLFVEGARKASAALGEMNIRIPTALEYLQMVAAGQAGCSVPADVVETVVPESALIRPAPKFFLS